MHLNDPSGARHPAQKIAKKQKRVVDNASLSGPTNFPPTPYSPYSMPLQPNMYQPNQMPTYPMPNYSNTGYDGPPGYNMPSDQQGFTMPTNLLKDPLVTNVAMQYGQALVGSGKQAIDREIEKYVPISKLKYYFAVDTNYVSKKLGLLFFPFVHSDWSVKYEQDEPVQPRYEINAPDLYIPTMAYVTYVLTCGLILGMQDRFSPEKLGIQASSALAWLAIEIIIELITLYITNIQCNLKTFDLVAFGGYKYVGVIIAILLSLIFSKTGYYIGLLYTSLTLCFFLSRTINIQVHSDASQHYAGNKRRLYFIMFVAAIQPVMMWWLSAHLISHS